MSPWMPYKDVIGNGRVIELLARSIRRDSLPPSLIFAGPAGVGKRLTALATAQLVNCTKPTQLEADRFDACGTCAACTRIARGVHADVLTGQPGDNESIKIEQVRDVVDRAAYRPFEGRRRVVIVDEADALVPPAQNALLKTLEEPPSSSVFILVTSRADLLLPGAALPAALGWRDRFGARRPQSYRERGARRRRHRGGQRRAGARGERRRARRGPPGRAARAGRRGRNRQR